MDAISIGLALLKAFNWVMQLVDDEKLRADGRRQQFVKQMTVMNDRLGIAEVIDREVEEADVDDLRDELTR